MTKAIMTSFCLMIATALSGCAAGAADASATGEVLSAFESNAKAREPEQVKSASSLPINVVGVQQYENLMPSDSEEAAQVDRLITLIAFEIESCDDEMYEGDFAVEVREVSGDYHAKIKPLREFASCEGRESQRLTLYASTGKIPSVPEVVIGERYPVEILPPAH